MLETAPDDLMTLESLVEIYTRLGERHLLAQTQARLSAAAPPETEAPAPTPATAAAPPLPSLGPPSGTATTARLAPPPMRVERAPTHVTTDPELLRPQPPVLPTESVPPPSSPSRGLGRAGAVKPAPPPPSPSRVAPPVAMPAAPGAPPVALTPSASAPGTVDGGPATTGLRPTGPAVPAPQMKTGRPTRRGGRLGELLVAEGVITHDQLQDALKEHRKSKERIGSVLARRGLVTEQQLVELLAREHGIPVVNVVEHSIDADVLALVPAHVARTYDVLPLNRSHNALTLAMADPTNVVAMDAIGAMTRLDIRPVVAAGAAIRAAIVRHYTPVRSTSPMGDVLAELNSDMGTVEVVEEEATASNVIELRESAEGAPVVKLVNLVLADAIRKGASDLHWEPYDKTFRVRFRLDGVLHEMLAPPKRHEAAIISRIKIMSSLDISERRLPQDGRMKLRFVGREIDFRVSILPTIFGEKAVLRILDKDALQLDLSKLGFDAWTYEKFTAAIHQPYGMVIITGPTGSGKTTTLYSAISTINKPGHNIMTAEDPVEYNLRGVNQVQINEALGRTFASVLRSFLRQDPDVILVGETRDLETAQISIRAALTGHLVFTTLHTNDSSSTVARLLDMGIQPFLLSSSLLLIVAQRLARRICKDCREPFDLHEDDLVPYGHEPTGHGRLTLYKGKGCQACNFTGMKGRVAIYEVMPISESLRDLILKNAPNSELRATAQAQGMKTLRQAGLAKVLDGTTTVDEVVRVTLG